MHRQLTQAGMNRILWKLLATQPDGKFTISNHDLETIDKSIGIRIDHHEIGDTFTLQLHKVVQPKPTSNIVVPGLNSGFY